MKTLGTIILETKVLKPIGDSKMTRIFKASTGLVVLFLLVFSSLSFSHTKLSDSSPTANATLESAPTELSLTYSTTVRLMTLTVKNNLGETIDLGFKPNASATKSFKYPLPSMSSGLYTVDWSILGEDGHKMTGNFSFSIQ